jgi:hypothetical protein
MLSDVFSPPDGEYFFEPLDLSFLFEKEQLLYRSCLEPDKEEIPTFRQVQADLAKRSSGEFANIKELCWQRGLEAVRALDGSDRTRKFLFGSVGAIPVFRSKFFANLTHQSGSAAQLSHRSIRIFWLDVCVCHANTL